MVNILWVAAGGALGAVLRYLVSLQMVSVAGKTFPWGTLTVNMTGCLLIGMAWSVTLHKSVPDSMVLFLMVGLIGSFTTFSTYGLEGFQLMQAGKYLAGITYLVVSNVVGLLLVLTGKEMLDKLYSVISA
ncbi:MAG: fluoride efflux transporter CrcB [Balneolaceae bacterium]